jgi:hypothetical protein
MDIPTTYLSLHDVTELRAAALASLDTPLILTVETKYGPMQISIYLRDADTAKIELLANNINAAMALPPTPKVACPIEQAAYAAERSSYCRKGSER